MAIDSLAMRRRIEIGGAELPADVNGQLESGLVVDRLAMPDTFSLVFRDPDRDVLQRAGLEIGTRVKISTALVGYAPEQLIAGEVVSIEADYDTLGTRAVVRGYDLSHRLNAGRSTQTFQNDKVSDVVRRMASAAGLQADVDDSGATLEHVIQPNMSDLDFLYSLAKGIGFDFRVDDETLYFKRRTEASTAPSPGDPGTKNPKQLVWGDNLLEFHARVSAAAQVGNVMVRGWDVTKKEPAIGTAVAAADNAALPLSPGALAEKVGGRTLVVVDRPGDTQQAAESLAKVRAQQVGSAAFEATAVALGSPALKAGVAVSVSGVDPTLVGKWVITSSRHEFGAGAYRTHLEFSGRQDRSLLGVVANAASGPAAGGHRAPGVVVATVTGNEDPEKMGRVRLKYPWLSDTSESFWARMVTPGAGPESGMVWIPQVGDEVLVAFEMGDFSHPIVLGGLWNGVDKPLLGDGLFDKGAIKRRGFMSRRGHKIIFFDGEDNSGIALLNSDHKLKITLNETGKQIHIVADGQAVLIEGTTITVKAKDEAAIEAKNISIKASGSVTIKGSKVALNPPGA